MLGDKFRLPAPSPSAIAQSRLVSMGTCTRLHRVRGEIYVFGGGVTTKMHFREFIRVQGNTITRWFLVAAGLVAAPGG